MVDGLQMRRIFLARFWQVGCLLHAQAKKGGGVDKQLYCLKCCAVPEPPANPQGASGLCPDFWWRRIHFGKGSRVGNIHVACIMWSGPQGIWKRSNICISDRITQPKLPLLFLTVFSKNVLIFGSEIWIFPSIRILGPSLHIRRNSVHRLPSWIWNIHQRYTHYLGLSYRRKNNYKTNARNKTKHKPEGFVPSQAHLENQMENSKDWFRNRRGPTLAFKPLLEKSNLAH